MKDEIKEILNYLKDNDNYIEDIGGEHKRISLYEAKILLDYITNLQEENQKLKEYIKIANVNEWFKGNDELDNLLQGRSDK